MVIQLTLEFAFQTLAADPRIQTKRIASLPAYTEISPYLALLHAEIARFTSSPKDEDIVTVALIHIQYSLGIIEHAPHYRGALSFGARTFLPSVNDERTPNPPLKSPDSSRSRGIKPFCRLRVLVKSSF